MKTQLKIQMLGSSFSIQSDQSKEHLEAVLLYLTEKIDEVLDKNAGIEPVKIALLAAINLADEIVSAKRSREAEPRQSADEIEKIANHLIQRIDDILTEPGPQSAPGRAPSE